MTKDRPLHSRIQKRYAWLLGGTILLTLAMGVLLRLELANVLLTDSYDVKFTDLRHAHSHMGFYGFLTFAWWLTLYTQRKKLVPRWLLVVYTAAIALATVLFALYGYNLLTIALSTLIALAWMLVAWRFRKLGGWLTFPLWGVLSSTLLVPIIAVMAKRDFDFSRAVAHVFVALIFLWIFVPASLASLKVRPPHPFAWLITTGLGAAYLVFVHAWPWPAGLFLSLAGLLLMLSLYQTQLTHLEAEKWPWWLSASWWGLALGLFSIGFLPFLQTPEMPIVAIHYTVLGPMALTLGYKLILKHIERRPLVFYLGLASFGLMIAAMTLAALSAHYHFLGMELSLIGGIGILVSTAILLIPSREAYS